MDGVISLISIAGIWLIWTFLWKRLCVDSMREDLFALRDDLFRLGKTIGFQHPLYIRLEVLINGTIRSGYSLSLLSLSLFRILNWMKYPGHRIESILHMEIIDEINDLLDNSIKDKFIQLKRRYDSRVTWFFIKTSLLFSGWIGLICIFYFLKEALNGMYGKTKNICTSLKEGALRTGYGTIKEIELQAESQMIELHAA
jgi:hypothetical protein